MTEIIIAVTAVVSIIAFNRDDVFNKLKFNAYLIHKNREWFRILTYGLIHADYMHFFINMFVLYSFGDIVELYFDHYFGSRSHIYFLLLYTGGLAFSTLYDFSIHKNDGSYNAVGASGAVSAIVFSSIILYPSGKIFLFLIPVGIPAPVFGILYLIYSVYMAKRGRDNIGHNAHFWGAIFGVVFTILLNVDILKVFLQQVLGIDDLI